ncbi:hypothetical protein KAI31_04795, partial [Candidatus Bathyarchaeota archaeon]|nr:hypothetical protein [Candidatus Bathyarchaeota archaeon]
MRPDLAVVDVYKMLFQSVFGIQHILRDKAKRYLEEELSTLEMQKSSEEPLIENISIDNVMVRVNLRPFKMRSLSSDKLFLAMVTSAKETKGTQKAFLKLWNQFKSLVEAGRLNFDESSLEDCDKKVEKENYPLYHHSERYRRSYSPAYRVVKREVFKRIFNI